MGENMDTCYQIWKRDKTSCNREAFRKCRCIVKKLIRVARANYITKKLDSTLPPKKLWKNIKNLGLSYDEASLPQFSPDNINKYFLKSVPVSCPHQFFGTNNYVGSPKFSFSNVNGIIITKALNRIKSNAVGDDEIPLKFLKIIMPMILPVISYLINYCLTESVFPKQWKISKIIPAPKCSLVKVLNDLRPISVLPVMSKLMEIIMNDQIKIFLDKHDMINKFQSGFRKNHSTATAMLKITDDLYSVLDNNHVALLVMLDFSRAFDMINHEMLLNKLAMSYKFSPSAIATIRSYLSDRIQYVKYQGEQSCNEKVLRGVPQGSVLGPLLFSLFINDIVLEIAHCQYHLYADNLQLYISNFPELITTMVSNLNSDLNALYLWSVKNDLLLNSAKSKVLRVYRGKQNVVCPSVIVNMEPIPFVEVVRDLGFLINSDFTWESHVSYVCSKVYSGLKQLSRFKHATPINTKKKLARTLLISHLLYADLVMARLPYNLKRTLQVAFNAITRYVYNLSRFDHITRFSKELLGCSFENYLKFRQCVFLFNVIYRKSPEYLFEKIQLAYSSRNISIIVPRHRLAFRANSFFVYGAQTWNSLPLDIKRTTQPTLFKEQCFNYFSNL